MKIRPKIIKALTGVKFTPTNANGANWRQQVFNNYRLHLLDLLSRYGEANDYGFWLNEMQGRHANIYGLANQSGDWQNTAYTNDLVGQYQHDYKGDLRFGTVKLQDQDNYDFNKTGIASAQQAQRYDTSGPVRTSGDWGDHDYKVDNLYSAITDDRRLLGRKGDWDENSNEYKLWQADLNSRGWETYLDTNDNYYKLRRLGTDGQGNPVVNPNGNPNQGENPLNPNDPNNPNNPNGEVPIGHFDTNKFDFGKLRDSLLQAMPNLLEVGRLVGQIATNNAIFDDKIKGVRPNLLQTYHTHRLVVGDEATKLAYYRRAAQGQTRASLPFTSDADRQMAYMLEARRQGDELRAQGDLADNQEIRRTSDESNQHQWANVQRDTDVANRNLIELNNANAAKLDLKAQRKAANWTSVNNYLQGIEYRKRQLLAEAKALQDQIWSLDLQYNMSNDPQYLDLQQKYQQAYNDAVKKYTNNSGIIDYASVKNDPLFKKAKQDLERKLYELQRQQYSDLLLRRNSSWFAKDGLKITYKKKDDLLYKTARDAVDHFRKMSKMSNDSTLRSRTKKITLIPHPGGKTRKYQQGGVAPFGVFTPVAVGGELATSSQASGIGGSSSFPTGSGGRKSGKSEKETSTIDVIKDLFSKLDGLPSDVNGVYALMQNFLAQQNMFGTTLDNDDLATVYLQLLLQINNIKFSKAAYDEAKKQATENDALNEFAVDLAGRVAVQTSDGKIKFASWSEIKESKNLNPLTNNDLLNLRAYSNDQTFNDGLFNIVNNGIGVSKIAEFIKSLIPTLGNSEQSIEGYTKKQSDLIRQGFELLLQDAPDGDYHYSRKTQDLKNQILAALGYIKTILPRNMQSILTIHADMQGVNPDQMLQALLGAQSSTIDDFKITAVTGKASKDGDRKGKSGSGDGDSTNSAGLAFVLGLGPRDLIEFNTGTSYATRVLGIRGTLQTKSDENLGQGATLQDATKSQQGGYLKWNLATFGGSKLNSTAYDHIILNDSTIMGVDLPVRKNLQGNEVPDFLILKSMEKADEEIRSLGIKENEHLKINEIYQKYQLPAKYDQNGNLNTHNYKRFAAMLVTLDEASLENPDGILSDEVALAGDVERDLYIEAMQKSGKKDYDLDGGFLWTDLGRDLLYKGTIFVPYDEDIAFAALSSGKPFKLNLPDNTSTVQQMQYAPATLSYKAPDKTLSQILNE